MIPKALTPAAVAVVLCISILQPAQAQREVDLFFGIAGEMIRQGVQNDQMKRQQAQQAQQQQAAEQAARAAQRAYEIEFYTRAQTALKSLGFYNMAVDGATGPGTRAAIAAYQAAFRVPGNFEENQLYDLEWRASEGWRSLDEVNEAEAGGFANRADFIDAKEGGFATFATFRAAQTKGFADATSYQAFVSSGVADKATFDADMAQLAAAEAAVAQCLSTTQAKEWGNALASCYAAARAKPADAAAALALEAALAGAERGLAEGKAQLAEKQMQLAQLLHGTMGRPSTDASTIRAEVNDLADDMLFIELHLQAGRCGELVGAQKWDDAITACAANVKVDHLAGDKRQQADELLAQIGEYGDQADAGLMSAQAAIAAESSRLALVDAKATASGLLSDVEAYGAQGATFEKGLEVAREIVALRNAAEVEDVARIKQHASALQALLDADTAYVSARTAMADARQQAEQTAVLEARRQAEMLNDFVLAYVSRNVTSKYVPALLPLSETLTAALADGNAEHITAAQAEARVSLERMGLEAEVTSFAAAYKAQNVSAEQLDVADAQLANASLALDTAIADAERLVDSIDSFAAAGGKFADPIGVARGLTRLKASMGAPSLPDLQLLHDSLAALVEGDPAYASANAQRLQTNNTALANSVALAGEELTGINDFLLAHIAANVTADDILSAVDLQMVVETALVGPASAETVRTLKLAREQLVAMDLAQNQADFISQQTARTRVATADLSDNGLALTQANTALLEGDADDLLVLRNSAAPHLVYDLLGNLRVDGGVASLCWLHPAPENPVALLMARQQLVEAGIGQLDVTQCNAPLQTADLAVLRRGDFLALSPSVAHPLISAFEDGRFKSFVTVSGSDALREADRLTAEANSIAGRIDNRTLQGFGLLQLTRGQGGICPAVETLQPHADSLAKRADSIAFQFAEPRFGAPMSADQAFVAAQRGQCSGIYAKAEDLRSLLEALSKADVSFTVSPIWVEADEIEAEVLRIAQESALQAQQAEAAVALLAAKSADQRSELQQRQDQLRAEYEERAIGAQKDIADMVRAYLQTGKSETLATNFPQTQGHLRQLITNKWVFTGTEDVLADYGTAVWQGRDLEALLVRIVAQRENAILGLYDSDCIVLGYLVDREFRVSRDPIEAACADKAAVGAWATGRDMQSVWNLMENE